MIFSGNKEKATGKTTAEKFSSRVLYIVATIMAVIFGCFYMIGYDIPSDDDPQFKSPLLTDAVIILAILLIVTALAAMAFAIVREVKCRDRSTANANNIPSRRIAAITAAVTVACMSVSFVAGSAHPMFINGTQYTTTFWLKATDMFIITAILLIAIAIITVITQCIRYNKGK
ncbi:hypothetical protein [Xylanibacter caecicola]|uniref:hypothetical protein n=1 Tax=Xylanibacter caecicola TaxID=2736294 RepID=UPI00258D5B94|nr:hypothetical protein [Xylanibacter caecicola]